VAFCALAQLTTLSAAALAQDPCVTLAASIPARTATYRYAQPFPIDWPFSVGHRVLRGSDVSDALGAGSKIIDRVLSLHSVFLPARTTYLFRLPKRANQSSLPYVAVGELIMSETEKTKPEKHETRPTDDGFLSPTPPKKKS